MVQTFKANEPLSAVRVYIQLNRPDESQEPFDLMTTYPKKVFSGLDYDTPLNALGNI